VIGKKLTKVECFGWEDSPHFLKLTFEDEARLIGSSYQTRFGDGDDVYVCDDKAKPDFEDAKLIWKSETKANNRFEATGDPLRCSPAPQP
jgi:hypothetical protein